MNEDNKKNTKHNIKKRKYNFEGIHTSKRKMEYFQKRRKQKRIKNGIFMFHTLIKVLLIIIIFLLCTKVMVAHFWYLPYDLFITPSSKNLKIIGNRITPSTMILKTLKKHTIPNKPIYLINTSVYEKEIEKLSPVKKAFVRRYIFPARFEITIEEKVPVLTIAPNNTSPEIAAITQDCSVISKDFLPIDTKKYKTYKILTYDDFKSWSKTEILSLNLLAERLEDFSGEKLIYIDIRNKNDVYVQLETVKLRLGELNSTIKKRISRLSSIMPQIENLKRQTEYVDLRWDKSTYLKKKSKDTLHVVSNIPKQGITTKENKNHDIKKQTIDTKSSNSINNKSENRNNKTQTINDVPKLNIQTVE